MLITMSCIFTSITVLGWIITIASEEQAKVLLGELCINISIGGGEVILGSGDGRCSGLCGGW